MCDDSASGTSGRQGRFAQYETRRIFLAQGCESHESDFSSREEWRVRMIGVLDANLTAWRDDEICRKIHEVNGPAWRGRSDEEIGRTIRDWLRTQEILTVFQTCQRTVGDAFEVNGDGMQARYVSRDQQVTYELTIVHRRSEYKQALEDEDAIVCYGGHSRYGRGAVFDQYDGPVDPHGNHWGDGRTGDQDTGIFRLGFPFVAIPFSDVEHHEYDFSPMPVENGPMPRRQRRHPWNYHPEATRRARRITLPESLRSHVKLQHRSASHQYWGFTHRGETSIFHVAGWEDTVASPMDIGATELGCRTFCHFGCSSRTHYWNIIRRREYKNYSRSRPPNRGLAYFTTAPSTSKSVYWLLNLLAYTGSNSPSQYYECHEYAKQMANRRLRTERAGFYIY